MLPAEWRTRYGSIWTGRGVGQRLEKIAEPRFLGAERPPDTHSSQFMSTDPPHRPAPGRADMELRTASPGWEP
jgi:hypothetical protein